MTTSKICVVVGAMPIENIVIPDGALVIAADLGLEHLKDNKIVPDLIVGDFDSLGKIPDGKNVLVHPVMKDETDMFLAVEQGIALGKTDFLIYGGIGGRLGHTVANLQLLSFLADRGMRGFLADDTTAVAAVKNSTIAFSAENDGDISVFALSGTAHGVCETGLLYSLDNAELSPLFPLGVSNSFTGKKAEVSVRDGILTVMWHSSSQKLVTEFFHIY